MNFYSHRRFALLLLLLTVVSFNGFTSLANADEPLRAECHCITYRVKCHPVTGPDTGNVRECQNMSCTDLQAYVQGLIDACCDPNDTPDVQIGHCIGCPKVAGLIDSLDMSSTSCCHSNPSDSQWVVEYKCTGRNGGSVTVSWSGSTYCEAFTTARKLVCERINRPNYGGACRCSYRIISRPTCSCCSSRCR